MWLGACAALAALAAARAVENVTVVRMPVSLEELHTITVDANTEFILDFIPNAEQSRWPTRLWVSSSGGDIARPLLLTIRQKAGASTWQLPQQVQGRLLFQVERTLCPDDSVLSNSTECVSEEELRAPGWFSLHAVSACARALVVQLRATPARDWRLAFQQPQDTQVSPEAPRVHYYAFEDEQEQVRLVVSSDDDVCATVAVQDYTCPITETLDELALSTLRMTVQRSGAVQLSRSRFPRGFYVVVVVHQSDEACVGEQPEQEDWLWEAAVYGAAPTHRETTRTKLITLDTRPALTRAQYAVAAGASLAVFACVYAAFGLLVLAQRWPRFGRLVAPRAVLRDPPRTEETAVESQIDASQLTTGTPARRKRRSSDATFDSSDNSDSDESDEESAPSPAPAASSARNGGPPAADAADSPDGDVGSPTNGFRNNINSDSPTVFVIPSGGVSNRGFAPSTPLDGPPAPEPPPPLDAAPAVANGQPAPAAGEEQQVGGASVRAAGAAARGGAGAAARAGAARALRPLPHHAGHRRRVLRAARHTVRRRLPDRDEPVGLAGPVLLQLPVRAPGGAAGGLQPRAVQRRLPAAGRAVPAAAAPPPKPARAPAATRGVRHPGALRAAGGAGRGHDGGGAAVGQLPRVPQPAQLPVRHGVHVRAGGAEHGEDLPVAPPRRQRARARHLRRAGRAHRHRGVGRAGRRRAVLGRVHGAARVHVPAAVAAHLLPRPVPPREGDAVARGAGAAGAAGARAAAAVLGAARHARHRQRRQLGLRHLRAVHAEHGLRVAPAVGAAVQHAGVHGLLPVHEAAARRAAALVRLGLPGRRGGGLGARALLLPGRLLRLGRHARAVATQQPRVPRAAVLRLARPVAHAVGRRAVPVLQRHADVGRRAGRRAAHRDRRLLAANRWPAARLLPKPHFLPARQAVSGNTLARQNDTTFYVKL